MKIPRSLFLRLPNLIHREQLDRELHDELTCHLELHIADNLHSGMSPEEARRDALFSGSNQRFRDSMELLGH